jgi:hypothetical protein
VACASVSTCGPCPAGLAGNGRTCTPCTLRVTIAELAGNASARAAEAVLSGVVTAVEGAACTSTGGFTFAWSTTALSAAGALLALPAATSPSLLLPARSLGGGQTVAFTLTACFTGDPSNCAASTYSFAVLFSPLVALLGGGGGVVGETPVTLSAAASYDPDGAPLSSFAFAWSCARTDGASAACAARDGTPAAMGTGLTQSLQLAGADGAGALYNVTLTVSQGGRTATASTTLMVKPGSLPVVSIAGSAVLGGAKANPSQQLVLFANATAFVPGAVATRWSLVAQGGTAAALPPLNLSDPAVAATAVTSVSMVIKPAALLAGAQYVFALSATDAVGAVGVANATVRLSAPARDGWADVAPASGIALETRFVLTASGWTADADELPLTYKADYFVEGLPDDAPVVSLTGGAFQSSPSITMQLPAGLSEAGNVITVRLTVRSAWGATVTSTAPIIVTWPVFEDTAAVNAFVEDATARAEEALQSGDSVSALQVVSGLASLLNIDTNATAAEENTAAAMEQRSSLLSIAAAAVNQSSSAILVAPEAIESTAALVSSLVAVSSQLSQEGTVDALAVLGTIASAGDAVSPAAAQSMADALSSVALASSANSTGGGSGGGSSANLVSVLHVLDSLASSQASGMAVPGQAPATVSTASIQMLVALDAPDSPRLLLEPISAPGSNSSFDPLPAGALAAAGGDSVSTLFLSLAFDVHGGSGSNNTGGLTRLAFSAGSSGEPVPVAGLATPLLFSIPASALGANASATCAWWDDAAGAYNSTGCAALPSPHPPGHELFFVPGFVVEGPASLAASWNISGPMAAGCEAAFLDCTNETARAGKLVVGSAALTCGNSSSLVLRAFVGAQCALSNATRNATCAWDAVAQTFDGPGCVAANATRCGCTHLTDFTSSPAVNIPVCSLADMVNFSASDIVTKLRLLFITVCILFGAMNVGAAVGWTIDHRERARIVAQLRDPHCGFRVTADGVQLWRFGLEPLADEIAAPTGPAVELAAVLGVPFARLRAALPDELLGTDFAAALGRRHGFSAAGMLSAKTQHRELLQQSRSLLGSGPTRRATRRLNHVSLSGDAPAGAVGERPPARSSNRGGCLDSRLTRGDAIGAEVGAALAALNDALAAAAAEVNALDWKQDSHVALEELIGTAMVLAFLQVAQLVTSIEIGCLASAASAYFSDLATPAGWSFDDMRIKFVTMLSPGILNAREKWWVTARLWKLILSQGTDGGWDASTSVAFALEVRSLKEVADVKPTLIERIKDRLADFGDIAEDLVSGDLDGALGGHAAQDAGSTPSRAARDSETDPQLRSARLGRSSSMCSSITSQDDEVSDDPLFCSPQALVASVPRRLQALRDGGVQAERVWTTLCCCALLQTLNCSWLWTDGDLYPSEECTVVDAGRQWVDAHAVEQPALAAALADGELVKAAARTVAKWHRAWERRVNELRRAEAITELAHISQLHRSLVELMRAVCTKHSTFAVFLSSPLDGLQRWQMWMILVTLIINQLMVNIWMYYAKAVNCCAEVQMLLGCGPMAPCRGKEFATCAELPELFAEERGLPSPFSEGLKDYTCTQFPNDDNPRDSLIVALISLAVALPVTLFLQNAFEMANDSEAPESWLFYGGITKLICGLNSHRKWHYTGPAGQPRRFVRWFCRSVDAPRVETLTNVCHSAVAFLTGGKPPWVLEAEEAAAEAEEEEAAAEAKLAYAPGAHAGAASDKASLDSISVSSSVKSAMALQRAKRRLTAVGLGGVYLVWTIFVWRVSRAARGPAPCTALMHLRCRFIFVYGMLIYKLLGAEAEQSFATSWGVSYGVGAAAEWQEIAKEAAKGVVILAILERLHVTRPVSWLEDHVDYLSVQALLFEEKSLSLFQQTRLLFEYRKRISDV